MKCSIDNCNFEQAKNSKYCSIHKKEARKNFFEIINKGKKERNERDNVFAKIFEQAHLAGMEAANNCRPTPMVVQEIKNQLDDNSKVTKEWVIADGVCGFAWVEIKPGNCAAANYMKRKILNKKNGKAVLFVHQFNQSMERKQAYAYAYANVLNNNNIKAYAYSRMD